MSAVRRVALAEYEPRLLECYELEESLGEFLWRKYSEYVSIEFPSPKTENCWQFISQGYVGHIPAANGLALDLLPKMPLGNLFGMLEVAYGLSELRVLEGTVQCDSLTEYFDRLAGILAQRVLDREKRGLYRSYVEIVGVEPCVKGRLDINWFATRPWETGFRCEYHENTPDLVDNQILLWTLYILLGSGLCSEPVLRLVRAAYQKLAGFVSLTPLEARACVERVYNRLNDDYKLLHGLCRFFLEHCGPTLGVGQHTMTPFLVNMSRLFERFVAQWLKDHLPERFQLRAQERVHVGTGGNIFFNIDLVLYDREAGIVKCVMDTKYKAKEPSAQDVEQMLAYAYARGCKEAILLYPWKGAQRYDTTVREIRLRSIVFPLDEDDIGSAGGRFLAELFEE